jgi:hypothetical protein
MYWQVFDFKNTSPHEVRNVHETQARYTEDPILRLAKDRRAHLVEQTALTGRESQRIITRAHIPASVTP